MSLLVFAIVVVIVAALLIWAADMIPMQHPLGIIVKVAILLVAALVICQRAGLL